MSVAETVHVVAQCSRCWKDCASEVRKPGNLPEDWSRSSTRQRVPPNWSQITYETPFPEGLQVQQTELLCGECWTTVREVLKRRPDGS